MLFNIGGRNRQKTGLFNIIPENLLNKYNRTFGKAFVDGRFCVFAVILVNRGSDFHNLF
jgi:hypothetical protein